MLNDYSNTIIYKICCKDPNIRDFYVGHTTNFILTKSQHKKICKNKNTYKNNMYKTINENGGWENWNIIEIAVYNCKNLDEVNIKRNEHYEQLKARNRLWYHEQKCQEIKKEEIIINNNIENIELSELIKQNNEFKDIIIKQNAQLLEKNNIIIDLLKKLKVE